MRSRSNAILRFVFVVGLAGTCAAIGPCDVVSYVSNVNPCGTILNCDPLEYEFVKADYQGPGVDVELDPFCTWPPFCDPDVDPLAP